MASSSYGILFQEYHLKVYHGIHDRVQVVKMLRILWVFCSFLLIIAFSSNLKAVFVVRSYEDPIDTVQNIKDRFWLSELKKKNYYIYAILQKSEGDDQQWLFLLHQDTAGHWDASVKDPRRDDHSIRKVKWTLWPKVQNQIKFQAPRLLIASLF